MFQKLFNYARKLFGINEEKKFGPLSPRATKEREDIIPSEKEQSTPTNNTNTGAVTPSQINITLSPENKTSQIMSLSEAIISSRNMERTQQKINHFAAFFAQGNRGSKDLLAIMNEFSSEVDKVTITSWFSKVASNSVDKKDLPEILKPLGDGNKSIALYNLAVKGLGIDRNENFPLLDTDDKKAIAKLFKDHDFGIDTLKRIKQPLLEPIEAEISDGILFPEKALSANMRLVPAAERRTHDTYQPPEIISQLTKSTTMPIQHPDDRGYSETPLGRRAPSTTSLDSALSVDNSRAASPEPTSVAPEESLSATTNEVDYAALSERISREALALTIATNAQSYLSRNNIETSSQPILLIEKLQNYLLESSLSAAEMIDLHDGLFFAGKNPFSKDQKGNQIVKDDLSAFLPISSDNNGNYAKLAKLEEQSRDPVAEAIKKLLYSQIEKSLDKVTATPESNTPSPSPASLKFEKLAPPQQQQVTTV